jgi:hypothetical protein
MALVLLSGSLPLDDVCLVLSQGMEWMLREDVIEKAKKRALTFTADSVFPPVSPASVPIARAAIVLAHGPWRRDSGAAIGLSLVNLVNSLQVVQSAGEVTSPFRLMLFDSTASLDLIDATFRDALRFRTALNFRERMLHLFTSYSFQR